MKKINKTLLAGELALCLTPSLLLAETCGTLPQCSSLGFTVSKADLGTKCKNVSSLKCPFDDYYFCSEQRITCAAGSYLPEGTTVCKNCTGDTYSAEGATSCTACPSGKVANSTHTACENPLTCEQRVAKAGGKLVTESNYQYISGLITTDLYLADTFSFTKDITLANADIYEAYASFSECRNDPNMYENVAFYMDGTLQVQSGSNYVRIYPYTQIETLKSGHIIFYNDVYISTFDMTSKKYGNLYFNSLDVQSSVYVSIGNLILDSSNGNEIELGYEADEVHVDIDAFICETSSNYSSYGCNINPIYYASSGDGSLSFCPQLSGNTTNADIIDFFYINGVSLYGIENGQYFTGSYPKLRITCPY